MRATTLLATSLLAALTAIAGVAPSSALDTPATTSTTPDAGIAAPPKPPAQVPGPLRPIVVPTPPATVTPDRRGARATPAPAEPSPRPLVPASPPPMPTASVLDGGFRPGAPGEKAAGRAVARLAAAELRLEKLAVTPGRDLEVWLVAVDHLAAGDDLTDTKRVSLGRLKRAEGDQTYRLPPEIDLRVYRSVVVWSRRERAARAYATLAPQLAQRTVKQKRPRRK